MRGLFAAAALAASLLTGCWGGLEEFPVARTTGRVLCDGKPVENASVYFEPLETGKSAIVGKSGMAMSDSAGRFTISTYGDEDGAVVGTHAVRVGPPGAEADPTWNCDCRTNHDLDVAEVNVTADGPNDFEISLPEKKAKDEPAMDEEDRRDAIESMKEELERSKGGS